ncbi:MAG: hypothetical protein CVU84_07545 [Firmicutes bacterium HGW-Firmicutes-1]|jgi:hypothetical protein|nr:MAG: hypothetical protein CVU84_07545 [Firmicutes bacterium HGW-Firmicutes-1]
MTKLFEIKEMIINLYTRFERAIVPIGKFLLFFIVLVLTNGFFNSKLSISEFLMMVLLATISIFIPASWIVILIIAFISFQLVAISLEATLTLAIAMLIIYLLFIRIYPKMAYFVILVPLLFALKIGYVIPIFAGLFFGPSAIIAVCTGVLVFKFATYIPGLLQLQSESLYDMPQTIMLMYKYMVNIMITDTSILLTIIVFAAVLIVTYIVSKLEYDYVWYIAIGAGTTVNMLGFIIGILILKSDISIIGVLIGSIVAGAICAAAQFMRFSLDYPRTEKVQFEDETYYYFVKAVPKVKITRKEKAITKIK